MLEHLARLSLVGFLQRKQRRGFIIPSNSAPKSFAVPAHDFERTPPALRESKVAVLVFYAKASLRLLVVMALSSASIFRVI